MITIINAIKFSLFILKLVSWGISFSDKFFIFLSFIFRLIYMIVVLLCFPIKVYIKAYIGKITRLLRDVSLYLPKYNLKLICRKKDTDDLLVINPFFEEKVTNLIERFDGKIFVDVGAHIGKYSLIVASKKPESKVIAIEGNPDTFKILKKI